MRFTRFSALAPATLALAALFSASGHALAADAPQVKFATTAGDFTVEVYPDKAPKTVENFLQYVKDKHYDGTQFHRVIDNFMVQGGGYDAKYAEKKTRAPVVHEGRDAIARGGPKNVIGTLAMARTNERSATRLHRVWQGGRWHGCDPENQDHPHWRWWPFSVRRSQDTHSYQLCNPGEINHEQSPSRTPHCQLRRYHP
jgi:hypothetical protein